MLTIHRFLALLFVLVIVGLYGGFFAFYSSQQETKAQLINDEFHRILNEIGYLVSTSADDIESLDNYKSLLNRNVAHSQLIDAMVIAHNDSVLLTTEPSINTISKIMNVHVNKEAGPHLHATEEMTKQVHQSDFIIYKGLKPLQLKLYLFPNKQQIATYFSETTKRYLLFSALPTLFIALLLYLIFKARLIKPLEQLRQFAYYHNRVPSQMNIRELEAIRNSMLQTFQRLGKESEALYHSARTDELSGLPNRQQLNERLTWLISECARTKSEFAYLFIDIDNFKNINDTLGHDAGDELLVNIAEIMQAELRGHDIIARFGGDEFVMVLNKYQNHIELNHVIERVLKKLEQAHTIRRQQVNISASIGVAFYPKDGTNSQELMKNADIAMYQAKKLGKNRVHYFTETLNQEILSNVALEQDLRNGLKNHEFELYYQPKTSVNTGEIVGLESLIRWHHPKRGLVPPIDFIPIAEQSGLIVPLGNWILEEAIQQQIIWNKQYQIDLPISVNVSALQFGHENFYNNLQSLINEYQFNPRNLDIEVTESILMDDTHKHISVLKQVRALGVTTSLDDFGTGYSSLAYLKTFPINTLKIDKSFLDDYHSRTGSIFIKTIIGMAHNLNINIVAEGVETKEQLNYLKEINCECYQGYLCSKPLPANEFIELVKTINIKNPPQY